MLTCDRQAEKGSYNFFDKTQLCVLSWQIKNFLLVQPLPSDFCCHRISDEDRSFVDSSFTAVCIFPRYPWCPQDDVRPFQCPASLKGLKQGNGSQRIPMVPKDCLYHHWLSRWSILQTRSWSCKPLHSIAPKSTSTPTTSPCTVTHQGLQVQPKP